MLKRGWVLWVFVLLSMDAGRFVIHAQLLFLCGPLCRHLQAATDDCRNARLGTALLVFVGRARAVDFQNRTALPVRPQPLASQLNHSHRRLPAALVRPSSHLPGFRLAVARRRLSAVLFNPRAISVRHIFQPSDWIHELRHFHVDLATSLIITVVIKKKNCARRDSRPNSPRRNSKRLRCSFILTFFSTH